MNLFHWWVERRRDVPGAPWSTNYFCTFDEALADYDRNTALGYVCRLVNAP